MRGDARRMTGKAAYDQIDPCAARPRRQRLVQHIGVIGQKGVIDFGLREDIRQRRHPRPSARTEARQQAGGAGEQRFHQELGPQQGAFEIDDERPRGRRRCRRLRRARIILPGRLLHPKTL